MSIVFSKNKEKRSRSSSSETNYSFVKNVTSRVSGLLPAAVTKWFSSPSSSNANGSAPSADATDSSTEDEAPESPVSTQPPPKRMRYTSPGSFNNYSSTETNCVGNDFELEPCSPYGTVQSPPGRTTFRRETNFVSTPLRSSEESVVDITEKDVSMLKSQHTMSTFGSSVATKRKSLFDSPGRAETSVRACAKTSCNTMRDPSQPCFKPSLLGSPFYPGRTMYGGASSSYINQPNIKLRKNPTVNETSTSDNTVSHSTRRIMDLLENYSSPLNEAKRIPHYTRTPRNNSFNSSASSTSPPTNKVMSYKTQELHVPSIASILRLKQKSRLMDTTNAARQIIASHSSTIDYSPYPSVITTQKEQMERESIKNNITKVKSRLTRPKRGESCDVEMELPTPVDLPTATLQIDQNNLPKFSFGLTITTSTATSTKSVIDTTANIGTKTSNMADTSLRKPDIVTSAIPYKFSSPVRIPTDEPEPETTPPKFTFGSPERSIEKAKIKKDDDVSCVVGTPKEPEKSSKEKDWQCSDCWVFNKPDKDSCVCCGGKQPSQGNKTPSKCTDCKLADSQPLSDKCVNCDKIKMNNVSKPLAKPENSSKWKCEDCWVSNDSSAEACVCCGAKSPSPKSTTVEDEWKCEDCWIKNKSSLDKCAACGGSKPGAKPSASNCVSTTGLFSAPLPKPDNAFKNINKTQTDKWECTSCLVRNDGTKKKCVCCDTEREGTTKETDKKSFNFGMNTNTTFKFGIDPKAQESQPKPAEVTVSTESKKEESETNNNVLSKTPTFTLGLPAKKSEDLTDSVKKAEEKTNSAPKINFSFGIPKTDAATTAPATTAPATAASTSVFGVIQQAPKSKEEEKEKPQVVPKIDFSMPSTQEAPKPVASIFSSPLSMPSLTPATQAPEKPASASVVPEKPATSTILNTSIEVEKADPQSNSLIPPPAATSAPTTAPTFSFGSGSLKIAPNLFSAPANTSATTSLSFGSPLQTAPDNTTPIFGNNELKTTASTMSVFPKSETVSLFQKNDAPASTAAPPALGAPPPMFSFGSGITSTPLAQTEKPKFNFSFGNNNKAESPFKPPENKFTFGASTENKFTLPTSNTIGGTNSISGNTLGGGNGLPTGNTMSDNILGGGNGLPANSMTSGTEMSQNSLSGGNGLPANTLQSGGIFGAAVQKENMWSANNNNTNIFMSNANNATSIQKPAGFSFGTSTPFNTSSPTAAFGSNTQSAPNVFGMNQNANQPSMFGSQNQAAGSVFGSPQPASGPSTALGIFGTPSMGATPTFGSPSMAATPTFGAPSMGATPTFGSPSMGATPTFGAPSQSIPTFEPSPAPAFNFGGQQQTGVFGFGQQQQQQQPQQQPAGGVYAFGASPGGAPQVQFNMGSAPGGVAPQRRVLRKAHRRTTPR